MTSALGRKDHQFPLLYSNEIDEYLDVDGQVSELYAQVNEWRLIYGPFHAWPIFERNQGYFAHPEIPSKDVIHFKTINMLCTQDK